MIEYPTVDRHYNEEPQECPDCPTLHHSLYTIGNDPVKRCFVCMSIEWHKVRAAWMRGETEDNTAARQPAGY